jgi:small subunit ribosomal protein S8
MVSTDPIADMLTRIRNAIAVRQQTVSLPHSKIKQKIAEILKENNYVSDVSVSGEGISKNIVIEVVGGLNANNITDIKRISTPGRRVYANSKEIPVVKGGRGVVIISTSKGIMSGNEAKQHNLGGEVICSVY